MTKTSITTSTTPTCHANRANVKDILSYATRELYLPGVQLASDEHLSIINGELDIGLLQFPHDGQDGIVGIDVITYEFFRRFPVDESTTVQDTAALKCAWNLGPEFAGTMHAEAMLMGLLTYFSEPNPSSRVDHWNALQDS